MEMRVEQIQMLLRLTLSSTSFYFLLDKTFNKKKTKKHTQKQEIKKKKVCKKLDNQTATHLDSYSRD